MSDNIQILMATYNGSKFISEQIESILSQTYTNWTLFIRDDLSKDNTLDIVKGYTKKYPDKIFILDNKNINLGACYNFLELLKNATSNYIMFADQDDFWLPDKIQVTLDEMKNMESKLKDIPIVIHTDVKLVDENLKVIKDSYYNHMSINPSDYHKSLEKLLVRNILIGCTCMINKELKNLVVPFPEKNINIHDLWVALIAVIFGKIGYIQKTTMLYRQHSNNTIGTSIVNNSLLNRLINSIKEFSSKKQLFLKGNLYKHEQAKLILENYKDIPKDKKIILEKFVEIPNKNFLSKRISLIKNGFLESKYDRFIRMMLYY